MFLLFKLVDEIFEKVQGITGNDESITKASVKSTVLMTGQRLCYGVASADVDILEDESGCDLWCWEKPKTELVKELKLTTNREPTFDDELVMEKLVDGWVENDVNGRLSGVKVDRPLSNCQKQPRIKQLLQFDKSYMSAFYGVWPRKKASSSLKFVFAIKQILPEEYFPT
ncbi:Chromatin assembly factor 1 subunit FSM [Sesamum angolense]|uniref:Chromatin assembly factor 1 subunit FSM n=1 Tax=Sesamum angolense TaxID=2727404 RepID=A0AAE1W300_9LAMI|nr:Chromatin assembly factor 1 subunit FSM [Sesamum angolense]